MTTPEQDRRMKLAREIVRKHYPEMPNDYSGRRVSIVLDAIQATEARMAAAVEALNGYQAAVAFVAADAWDGCPDCIDILKAARCADTVESLTPDEIAANLKRIRPHYQPAIRSQSNG